MAVHQRAPDRIATGAPSPDGPARRGHDLLLGVLRAVFRSDERSRAGTEVARLGERELSDLLDLSWRHEIGPLVARQLLTIADLPTVIRKSARLVYDENLARNLYLRAETLEWIARLDRAGIPCRALKGVLWSPLLYGDLGARASADIDLLVRPEQRDSAARLAASLGFEPDQPAGSPSDPDSKAIHLEPRDESVRYTLDLHWYVELPRLVPLDHAAFWRGPQEAADLPPDLVGLVLCLHLWRHAVTLKTLVDFAAFVNRFDEYVPEVRRRLEESRAGDGLDLALMLAQRVLGVRSRFTPERHAKTVLLPWLERCLRVPFADRGRYFAWLVFPLQFDGLALPVRRCAAHLVRPDARDGGARIASRVRRVVRVAARATFSGGRFAARRSGGR